MKYKNEIKLFLITYFWGHGMIASKFMLTGFDTVPGLTVRYAMALPVIALHAFIMLRKNPDRKKDFITKTTLLMAMAAGTCSIITLVLQVTALKYTTASNASFIMCTYTMIVPCMAAILFKNRVHKVQILGFFICFLGTALISRVISFDGGLHIGLSGFNFGDALMLGCSLSCAAQTLLVARLSKIKVDSLGFVLCQIMYSFVMFALAWGCFFRHSAADFTNIPALLGICYTGAIGSGVLYIIYCNVITQMTPAAAGLILSSEPVFTTVAAAVIPVAGKTEPVVAIQIAGGALIVGTIMSVQYIMNRGKTPVAVPQEERT